MQYKVCNAPQLKILSQERIVSGYAATWDLDSGGDQIEPGAFRKTIMERGPRNGSSMIKFMNEHCHLIGLPIEMAEDNVGLAVQGRVSKTSFGDDLLVMVEDKTLDRMSIGYEPIKWAWMNQDGNPYARRTLQENKLYEFSLVAIPMNDRAVVDGFKSGDMDRVAICVLRYLERKAAEGGSWKCGGAKDLKVVDGDWDPVDAHKRVQEWAGGTDWDPVQYRKGFCLFDAAAPDLSSSYKLAFADVRDGNLVAISAGVRAAAAALKNIDLSDEARDRVKGFLNSYYKKMDSRPPWDVEDKNLEGAIDVALDAVQLKEGRRLSATSVAKVRAALAALQTLLGESEDDEEKDGKPATTTSLSPASSKVASAKPSETGFDPDVVQSFAQQITRINNWRLSA